MKVTKCAAEGALANFAKAKKKFFNKTARFPTFHKWGRRDSFSVGNSKFHVEGVIVVLPKIGCVQMTEELRLEARSYLMETKLDELFEVYVVEADWETDAVPTKNKWRDLTRDAVLRRLEA